MPSPTNTRFALAVHVLAYLNANGQGRSVGAAELAESTGANPVHIRKVLGPLREAGMVDSTAGQTGGWHLVRPANEIPLDHVWTVVQGIDSLLGRHRPSATCTVAQRVNLDLDGIEWRMSHAIRRELATQTVADLWAAETSVS